MTTVIGVDPGPVTGICVLRTTGESIAYNFAQADPESAVLLVDRWMAVAPEAVLVVEDFVIGSKTGKSNDPKAGQKTRNVLERLRPRARSVRKAADVKPWATDERLKAAGILDKLQGMRHAKDGARHALFHAVKSGALPDPLSRTWKYQVS